MPKVKTLKSEMELADISKPENVLIFDLKNEEYKNYALQESDFKIEYCQHTRTRTRKLPRVQAKNYKLTFFKDTSAGNNIELIIADNAFFNSYSPTEKDTKLSQIRKDLRKEDPGYDSIQNFSEVNVKELKKGDIVSVLSFKNGRKIVDSKEIISIEELSDKVESYVLDSENFFIIDKFFLKFKS